MGGTTIRCIFIFLLQFWFQAGHGQRQLVLVKENKIVSRFSEGDQMRFKRKDRDFFQAGTITGIYREYFKMGEHDTTWLYQVKAIDLRGHSHSGFKTAESGAKLILAGVLLILIDALNSQNGFNGVDTGMIVVSSTLVGTGILMQFVNNNVFKIGRKKKVIVMG